MTTCCDPPARPRPRSTPCCATSGATGSPGSRPWSAWTPTGASDSATSRARYRSPPFPTWSITDRALVTMAKLLRRYHDAASSFTPPPGAVWNQELADPTPGDQPVLCHNDVCPENVVFSEAIAVALLDFDFAAPGRREWDVAAMARMCVPVETAEDAARTGRGTLDPVRRLRVVADAYGLDEPGRDGLLDALAVQFDQGGAFVRRRVEAGEPAFVAMWEAMGGQERYDRRQAWFDAERPQFLTALLEPR
ncbi:MAG: phosphotransferase [Acidimicrobiales bacterium]|nr:phosphotransferase [Acidimicrobiales bacterium]